MHDIYIKISTVVTIVSMYVLGSHKPESLQMYIHERKDRNVKLFSLINEQALQDNWHFQKPDEKHFLKLLS
jgi:hypothetical protein